MLKNNQFDSKFPKKNGDKKPRAERSERNDNGASQGRREQDFREKREFGSREGFGAKPSFNARPKRDFQKKSTSGFGSDDFKSDFASRPNKSTQDFRERDFSEKRGPRQEFGGRPSFNDRPKRDFQNKSGNDFGSKRDFSGGGYKVDFASRPSRDSQDFRERDFSQKRERGFSRDDFGTKQGSRQDFGGRPSFNDRPKRDFQKKSGNEFGPKRDFSGGGYKGDFASRPKKDSQDFRDRDFSQKRQREGSREEFAGRPTNQERPKRDFKKKFGSDFGSKKDFSGSGHKVDFASGSNKNIKDDCCSDVHKDVASFDSAEFKTGSKSGVKGRSRDGRRSSASGASFSRPSSGRGRGRSARSGRSRSGFKRFNPLDFIKTVTEQVIAPAYNPKNMFTDFAIEPRLKQNIVRRGYKAPTPIQDEAIPLLLEGKDIVATANTGTGKTAAFLIPMINNILTKKSGKILIITPTRELAGQIEQELILFKEGMGLHSALCIGGLSISFQIQKLRKNPQFVIGTPGRLRDLEGNRAINFDEYTSIVLDEVDTMLDMGFITDISYIISKLPQKRQSLFFSATIPQALNSIMADFLVDPVMVSVKKRQSAENVNQEVVKVGAKNKIELLHELLIKPEFTRTIIFLRTKRGAEVLAEALRERGFGLTTIHGDKTQAQRKKALQSFKDNKIKTLLATDVVARGIDIDNVSHVINYDLPQTHEDYIHRIGRTGRANKIGYALTFID